MTRPRHARAVAPVEPLPGWITWPLRVLAVIFVVPVKLAWDGLVWLLRAVWNHGLRQLLYYAAWLPFYYAVCLPVYYVLWVPVRWVAEHVIAPVFVALCNALVWFVRALGPFWRALGRATVWVAGVLHRFVLRPIGLAIAFVWRWSVVPVAQAIAWARNHSVVLLWRYLVVIPVSWAWRNLVVPPIGWVRSAVLRPIAETTRRVLASLGL